jgi:hypothetical protein
MLHFLSGNQDKQKPRSDQETRLNLRRVFVRAVIRHSHIG